MRALLDGSGSAACYWEFVGRDAGYSYNLEHGMNNELRLASRLWIKNASELYGNSCENPLVKGP